MEVSPKLLNAWRQLLELCRVDAQETVLLLTGAESNPEHITAAKLAIAAIGAHAGVLQLGEPPTGRLAGDSTAYYGPTAATGNRAARAAMLNSDFIIDLMGMYRGSEQEEILAAGARILLVKEPPETFIRLLPRAHDKEIVKAAEAKILAARTLRATSAAGTDLTVTYGQYPALVQYGYADEKGRWDHAPSAFIARWPDEGSANGTVVLNEGDTILPFKSYVRTPIELTVREGFVTRVEGGLDARYLRDYIDSFKDRDGYAVSHLGWGLHDRAHWTMLGMYDKRQTNGMDARSYAGNFMFSLGPNAEAGGSRHTPCHLDIPMSACSVWLDDELMVEDGRALALSKG